MRFVLLLTWLSFSATVLAQKTDEKARISALLTTQSTAWNKGDINTFMDTYWKSDSLLFIGKNGVTYGWQATLDRYKKTYPDAASMGKLDFKLLEFKQLAADTYFLVGRWHLARTIGDLQGHFSLVVKRFGNKWKIIADHSS
jgi:ketosteroid isomerase-like protein